MDSYLVYQMERMGRARTLADIHRIEDQISRNAQALAEPVAMPAERHGAGWPLGFLAGRRRRAARGRGRLRALAARAGGLNRP